MELNIKYLGHSGFGIAMDDYYLMFDYHTGGIPYECIKNAKYPIIFASHAHADHYSKKIFSAIEYNENTQFVLSDDIKTSKKAKLVKPNDNINIRRVNIQTFDSSDQGVCFLLQYNGIKIFHAGDLNLWSWRNENSHKEIEAASIKYYRIVNEIMRVTQDIDVAFFPVDPRMKTRYEEGAAKFLEVFNVGHFFPMHMWGNYRSAKVLKKYDTGKAIIHKVSRRSRQFHINIDS